MPPKSAVGTIFFGLLTLFIVFGLVGGWMFYAPLASAAISTGTVSADVDKKMVQHLEGGIVEKILVKDGDVVKKGDTLLKLGNSRVKGELQINEQQYLESLALESRLKAQRDDRTEIIFSEKLMALYGDSNTRELIVGQQEIFRARERVVASDAQISEEQISQLERQKEGIQHTIDSKNLRLSSLSEELIEWEELYEQQMIDKLKLRDVRREKIAIEGDVATSESRLHQIDIQISEIGTKRRFRKKEFKESTLSKLVDVRAKLSQLKSTVFMAKDTLSKTLIKAPIGGTVVGMKIHTIGAIINRGSPILEIIPQNSKLLIIAEVQTTDIDKVQVGLLADIRFSAFNNTNTQVLEGEIVHVSADTFTPDGGVPYYEAKIELTKAGVERLNEYKFKLVAGMPAEIMIRLEERTVMEYLIKPFKDMLSRAFNEE